MSFRKINNNILFSRERENPWLEEDVSQPEDGITFRPAMATAVGLD